MLNLFSPGVSVREQCGYAYASIPSQGTERASTAQAVGSGAGDTNVGLRELRFVAKRSSLGLSHYWQRDAGPGTTSVGESFRPRDSDTPRTFLVPAMCCAESWMFSSQQPSLAAK